ncbi:unnamed protein product, partial [marine sediment metagenome]
MMGTTRSQLPDSLHLLPAPKPLLQSRLLGDVSGHALKPKHASLAIETRPYSSPQPT